MKEGLNFTTLRDVILASILVFGFLPILSFLLITLNVPKDEILTLFVRINSAIMISKKLSMIVEEKFFEKPRF
jgi:hypothetical protein